MGDKILPQYQWNNCPATISLSRWGEALSSRRPMKWDGIRPSYREQLPPVIVAQVYHSIPLNGEWSDLTATLSAELDNDRIPIVLHEIHVFYWRMQLPVRCRQLARNSHRGSLRRWLRKGCSSVGFM
jgi:hypothetical protein